MVHLIALNDTYLDDRNQRCVIFILSILFTIYRGVMNEYQPFTQRTKKKAKSKIFDKSANAE